jgi:RNA polymerase sigma factor (sigma-70 family)
MQQNKSTTSYLSAEAKKDYLSREDLLKLIRKYKRTKNESEKIKLRDQVIANNLRFVLKIANSYSYRSNSTVDDLFQCGILGLIDALDKFKMSKGCAFSTYATWHVLKHIRDEISSSNVVDTKRFSQGAPKARLYKKLLIKSGGDYEKFEVLLRKNGITRKMQDTLEHILTMSDSRSFLSLSAPVSQNSEDFTLADTMAAPGPSPEAEVIKTTLHEELRAFIDQELTEKERFVIQSLYFDERTARYTAQTLRCSGASVRSYELRALRKLIKRFKQEDGNPIAPTQKFKTQHLEASRIIDPEAVKSFLNSLKKSESVPAGKKKTHVYDIMVKTNDGSFVNFSVVSPTMRGAINFVRENTRYYFDIEVVKIDGVPNPVRGLNYFFRDMTRDQIAKVLEEVAVSRWK